MGRMEPVVGETRNDCSRSTLVAFKEAEPKMKYALAYTYHYTPLLYYDCLCMSI